MGNTPLGRFRSSDAAKAGAGLIVDAPDQPVESGSIAEELVPQAGR